MMQSEEMVCPFCSADSVTACEEIKLITDLLELSDEGLTLGDIVTRTGIAVPKVRVILRALQTDGDIHARVEPVMRTVYKTKDRESR